MATPRLNTAGGMPVGPSRGFPPPVRGEPASGHGLAGTVADVPRHQPLADEGVWRVTLVGEAFGRLARRAPEGHWHLLELDELTEAQLDALDAATGTPSR
jgi:hypothetical protein